VNDQTGLGSAGARRSPSRAVIAAILVAHLLAGFVAGVALDRFVLHHRHGPFAGMGPGRAGPFEDPAKRAEVQKHMADRVSKELDLTAAQRSQVETMLPRHLAAFDSLRKEMGTRLQSLLDSSSAEMETILTPEQRVKWAQNRKRFPSPMDPPPR
jgi:Spy/CpxP family protein refolding chaperone